MKSPVAFPSIAENSAIQIEPAYDCDGSICHQPLFDEDGGLHFVAPHCHLIEQTSKGPRCYAVFCDFPVVARQF